MLAERQKTNTFVYTYLEHSTFTLIKINSIAAIRPTYQNHNIIELGNYRQLFCYCSGWKSTNILHVWQRWQDKIIAYLVAHKLMYIKVCVCVLACFPCYWHLNVLQCMGKVSTRTENKTNNKHKSHNPLSNHTHRTVGGEEKPPLNAHPAICLCADNFYEFFVFSLPFHLHLKRNSTQSQQLRQLD